MRTRSTMCRGAYGRPSLKIFWRFDMHDTRRPEDRAGVGMRARGACCLLVATLVALSTAAGAVEGAAPVLFGFDAGASARQQALEQSFDGKLDPADLRAWLKNLASDANHVGS